jgi:protein dithiol oxidoreductase (disulfide-forming)
MLTVIKKTGFSGSLAAALILASLAGSSHRSEAQALPTWEAEKNYHRLPNADTRTADHTVVVTEVFGYFCPHCFHLLEPLQNWEKQGKPDFVSLNLVPVVWPGSEPTRQLAILYYTIAALHREGDLHALVFKEIHIEHRLLMDKDSAIAEQLQADFMEKHGVSKAEFLKISHSAQVTAQVAHAEELATRYQIASVPTLVIADKYSADVGTAGGEQQLFQLINDLAAREQQH